MSLYQQIRKKQKQALQDTQNKLRHALEQAEAEQPDEIDLDLLFAVVTFELRLVIMKIPQHFRRLS